MIDLSPVDQRIRERYPHESLNSLLPALSEVTLSYGECSGYRTQLEEFQRVKEVFNHVPPRPALIKERIRAAVGLFFGPALMDKLIESAKEESQRLIDRLHRDGFHGNGRQPLIEDFPVYLGLSLMEPFVENIPALVHDLTAIDRLHNDYLVACRDNNYFHPALNALFGIDEWRGYDESKLPALSASVKFFQTPAEAFYEDAILRIDELARRTAKFISIGCEYLRRPTAESNLARVSEETWQLINRGPNPHRATGI
jgi:hypothetical protein